MQSQNKNAVRRIVSYVDSNFSESISEQVVPQLRDLADLDHDAKPLDNAELISIVNLLMEEGVFVTSELLELDEDEESLIYVTRIRSIASLNELLDGTQIRVIPTGDRYQIGILLGIV